MTLTEAEVCRTLSTGGAVWRCDPAQDLAAPAPLVLYTRVRSPRDTAVVHRWYRGDVLRKTVTLAAKANPTEGYRTYSRQTVDEAGEWRVEVRATDGTVLHEERFTVR